jgi:antitoxin ParD1/3/4
LVGKFATIAQRLEIAAMANVEKLSVALTAELAELVRHAVESGDYASTSEVVREALREWRLSRQRRQQHVEELRNVWQEGLNSGPGLHTDMEGIRQEARRRKAEHSEPAT